jgi:hypothetical protein
MNGIVTTYLFIFSFPIGGKNTEALKKALPTGGYRLLLENTTVEYTLDVTGNVDPVGLIPSSD